MTPLQTQGKASVEAPILSISQHRKSKEKSKQIQDKGKRNLTETRPEPTALAAASTPRR
jgi:hypothetical protein